MSRGGTTGTSKGHVTKRHMGEWGPGDLKTDRKYNVPVHNDHPWDPKIVAVVYRWRYSEVLCYIRTNWDLKIGTVIDRWSLFVGGR